MGLIRNNFDSLPANVRELTLAVRSDEELNNLLPCVTIAQGVHVVKNPLRLTIIEERK